LLIQDQDQDSEVPRPRPRPRRSRPRPRPRLWCARPRPRLKDFQYWKSMTGMDCHKQKDWKCHSKPKIQHTGSCTQ